MTVHGKLAWRKHAKTVPATWEAWYGGDSRMVAGEKGRPYTAVGVR